MKKVQNIIYIFAKGLFAILFLSLMGQFILSLDTDLGKAIITGSFTLFAAVIGVLITKHIEEKNKIIYDNRQKKIPSYEQIISFYLKTLNANKPGGKKPTDKETAKFFEEFTSNLIVWGSDDVIDAYAKVRNFGQEADDTDGIKIIYLFENLMLELRKDLGHENNKIDQNHALLATFITDLSKHTTVLDSFNDDELKRS